MKRWGEKRYLSLDFYLKQLYGEKLYKITLNGGMSCPNRDGTIGTGGCIFCSPSGSGDFAGCAALSITDQLRQGKKALQKKRPVHSFIAYFQAFTNTYAPAEYLRSIFLEAISDPDVRLLSIATRPDCLDPEILELLAEIQKIKPVWIELGLQSVHPKTAAFIRRGYELSVFEKSVSDLHQLGIPVIVHTILYLPGESIQMMYETVDYLNQLPIQGIKFQLLHVLKGTDLASYYESHPFHLPDMEEYIHTVTGCISRLRPDIVIHRLTGDGPKDLLIAPLWSGQKRTVLNKLNACLKAEDLWQGKEYQQS